MTYFFRPAWTCGRSDSKHEAAIYYNLIEGLCYYYEDLSAHVVGSMLDMKRNEPFSVEDIACKTNVKAEVLQPFLEDMAQHGLLTNSIATAEEIQQYRDNVRSCRKTQVLDSVQDMRESTVVGTADAERMYAERTGHVVSVMFELTYRCSEMCIHCYNVGATRNAEEQSKRGQREEMRIEEYKRIIDELYDQGLTKVTLSGGDPFSKAIVWDIIAYIYEKGLAIDIFTNGISVVNDVKRLADFYPRSIGISLYSDVASVHDSITRIPGSHDRTLAFIEHCSELALPMMLKCCIIKPNVKTYCTVKDVAYKYGALPQFDLNITDSVDGDRCASTFLRLGHEEMELVLRDRDLPYYIGEGTTTTDVVKTDELMCSAGISTLCITPEGNIQPCCAFPMKIGNVRDGSLEEIITHSKTLAWWKNQRIGDCTECHTKPYCVYCQMCAGNNFVAHGNPLRPSENNCSLAKERYELAEKMRKGQDPLQGRNLQEALDSLHIEIPALRRLSSINYREQTGINGVS